MPPLHYLSDSAWHQLVRRQHDLLRVNNVAHMLSFDEFAYEATVDKIADWLMPRRGDLDAIRLSGAAEGLRSNPPPYAMEGAIRELWLACLWQALQESEFTSSMREAIWSAMESLSIHMLNTITERPAPHRYSFRWVQNHLKYPALGMCRR